MAGDFLDYENIRHGLDIQDVEVLEDLKDIHKMEQRFVDKKHRQQGLQPEELRFVAEDVHNFVEKMAEATVDIVAVESE